MLVDNCEQLAFDFAHKLLHTSSGGRVPVSVLKQQESRYIAFVAVHSGCSECS